MATTRVRLGDTDYEVPALTWGQLEQLAALEDEPEGQGALALFQRGKARAKILLARAKPPIGDFDEIECTVYQLRAASAAILRNGDLGEGAAPGKKPPAVR